MFLVEDSGIERWPPECKSGALPAELIPHDLKLVGRERLELDPPLSELISVTELPYARETLL